MNPKDQEDKHLSRLFGEMRKEEKGEGPAFSEMIEFVNQKQRKMKRRKVLTAVLALVLLTTLALYSIDYHRESDRLSKDEVPVLKAEISLYERLMKDGKIITNDIHFDYDLATIRPESMKIIRSVADMMKQHPDIQLSIEGHTDNTGSSSYNLKLSSARAAAVKEALGQLSIDQNRMLSKGYGEDKPIANNENEAGRANNRRVEFVLVE